MIDFTTSPSVRSGNVLALLDTLYTSGFAMASPSTPMLKGRTMHTLYAISFIVYVTSSVSDWVHIWAILRGHVATFEIETWLATLLVSVAVSGSMFTWLLLVLCVENAFAHRLDITPYRSGFALVTEAVVEWFQAFNNFRVTFLQMLLHDAPMTFINFFFITSCRCAGPSTIPWTLLASTMTAIASTLWRFTMLHFAYRRMFCPLKKASSTVAINRMPTAKEHLRIAVDISDGGRLEEIDECWPVRWAKVQVYGELVRSPEPPPSWPGIFSLPCVSHFVNAAIWIFRCVRQFFRLVLCSTLTVGGYIFMCVTCCIPYCRHYTCRKNSFYHRHKCARSLIRYSSILFHYSVFIISLILCLVILSLNILLMSSVHVIGPNNVPPEIDRMCVTMLPSSKEVHAIVLPARFFSVLGLAEEVNRRFTGYDRTASTVCKPIWEDGGLGMGLKRQSAGPWQTRRQFSNGLLAVATQAIVNTSQPAGIHVWFDVAELRNTKDGVICIRGNTSDWTFVADSSDLSWPYFSGCRERINFAPKPLIECYREATTTQTTPAQGWKRRTHRPRRPLSRKPTWI